jgi:hypothetical protein
MLCRRGAVTLQGPSYPTTSLCSQSGEASSNTTGSEDKFDLNSVFTALRVGSDHNPLIVDTGGLMANKQFYFRFNNQWVHQEGFCEWVKHKWPARYKYEPVDHWHIVSSKLRRAIKGWGHNNDSCQRKLKQELLREIEDFMRTVI